VNGHRLAGYTTAVVMLCSACSFTGTSSTEAPQSVRAPDRPDCPSWSGHLAPQLDTVTLHRVRQVVGTVAAHSWNPAAQPSRGKVSGGVFINWRPGFDGKNGIAAATNIQGSGSSDAEAGADPRHDPLADLLILRGTAAYLATGVTDPAATQLACRLGPVVAAEFEHYGVDRGWVYPQLIALSRLQPSGPWRDQARRFAILMSQVYIDPVTGAERDPRRRTYRSDWSAETAAALVLAGVEFDRPDWVTQGRRAARRLVTHGANSATGLIPGVLQLRPQVGRDAVIDPLVKVGAQAQLLDSLLTIHLITGDQVLLEAVVRAVGSLNDPGIGVIDREHGGYFYAVDADGRNVRTAYKETRQAWMAPLLLRLAKATKHDEGGEKMRDLVRDGLFRQDGAGYAYRVAPDWGEYVWSPEGPRLSENWISAEATGIALAVLTGEPS